MNNEEQHRWMPVWALPNVSLTEPINTHLVAMVRCDDERIREVAKRHPFLSDYLQRFHDEFGSRIWPTVLMLRADAPATVRTNEALGAFRDAISISAITSSHCRDLTGILDRAS